MSANIVGPLYWYEATLFFILSVISHGDGFRERRALEWLIPITIIIYFLFYHSQALAPSGSFSLCWFLAPSIVEFQRYFFLFSAWVRDCLLVADSSAVFTFWRQTAGRSYHPSRNKRGPRTEPCKTPLRTDLGGDKKLSMHTDWVLLESQAEIQRWSLSRIP